MIQNFLIGFIFASIVVGLSFKAKFLSKNGSALTFLMAVIIFGFGGIKWSIPILTFFFLSSILSKLKKRISGEILFAKNEVRDAFQVLANGGIAVLILVLNIFYQNEIFFYLYVASLAAVCADTWATESGTIWKTNTYNALTFKKVEQGVSGGISLIGSLGGFLGSIIIALSGLYWFEENPMYIFTLVALAGIIGSFADSLIGASFQVQYKCKNCLKITERKNHCSENTIYHKGIKWIDNDVVNLMASLTGVFSFLIIFRITA